MFPRSGVFQRRETMSSDAQKYARELLAQLREDYYELALYWAEHELEIIAFLETQYQDYDNPKQEQSQRVCRRMAT